MEAWYYETTTGASCVCLFKGITQTAKAKSLWGVRWNLWNNALLKKTSHSREGSNGKITAKIKTH